MKGHHHRRRSSAVRLFVATWVFIAALCTAAVLTTWATTSDEPVRSARPPPPRPDDTRRAVALALAPCSAEMQLCTAVTRDPFPRATGTAQDAIITKEMRSVLGRTLATIRDDGAGDLREAPTPRATCVVPTRDGTFAQRLAAWAAQSDEGRVVFTVADANYADYMNDARLDTLRTFGTNLLVVALDEAAAVAACAAGCSVVRFSGGNGKEAIYEAKYGTMHLLLEAKRDATFREMDIWHLRDPIDQGMTAADVVFGVHQDNPYNINAGWVHARGGGAWTARLFADLVRYLKLHPQAFDQQVLNCMVSVSSQRDECDAKGVASQDPVLRRWTTPPARVTHATIGPDVLVAHARPYVMACA